MIKIAFFGFNEFGVNCLEKLLKNNLYISLVIIPKENKTNKFTLLAKKYKFEIFINSNNDDLLIKKITKHNPDLITIASFPKILSNKIIKFPKYGTINVHPSLLPKYRGALPINWTLINDEKFAGVTIHYAESKVDSGNIIAQKKIVITNNDDINSLFKKVLKISSNLLLQIIKKFEKNKKKFKGIPQNHLKATIAPKRHPNQSKIDWSSNTREIFSLVRSLKSPLPNAFSFKGNNKIEFKKSFLSNKFGRILAKIKGYYLITTGDGVILLKTTYKLKIGEILK